MKDSPMAREWKWEKIWGWGFLTAFFSYSLAHFIVICRMAVDVPFWDEWELFVGYPRWSKDFLLGFQAEHRSLAAKMLLLLNLDFFHLNFRYQVIFNALLYAALVFLIWKTVARKIRPGFFPPALIAMLPFVSTLAVECHMMAFLGGKHLYLITFLLGTYALFFKDSFLYLAVSLALLTFSLYSFAGCILGVSAVCVFYVMRLTFTRPPLFIQKISVTTLTLAAAVFFWLQGFRRVPAHPSSPPWRFSFIRYFGEVVSLGFGFTDVNPFAAFACLALLFFALALALRRTFRERFQDRQYDFLIALSLGVLAMLSLITFGRSGFPLDQAKSSRYAEIAAFLPLLGLALFQRSSKLRVAGSAAVLLLLALGLHDNFGFKPYQIYYDWRMEGKRCVEEMMQHPDKNPKGMCPTVYPQSITEKLMRAKEMKVHFTQIPFEK
ncbi:MAG: hypothetical protein U1F57_03250 [bacterium]